jgi:hypothetical protein
VKRIEILIAYSIACASAALASLYGFMSASGYYGIAKGLGLCCVAFVGCHGPAWIAKVKREIGWPAAIFGCFATAACLGVTLYGGLGTIASGGADQLAEKVKASGSIERDRTTLQRLEAERQGMVFAATTQAAQEAAQRAVEAAERARSAECGNGDERQRGRNCRAYEATEQAKRDALAAVMANRALTDQAAALDQQIAAVNARLDRAPAVTATDPQASTFSTLTGLSIDTSAALYAFLFSIALELAAMFAMMVAYSTPKVEAKPQQVEPEIQPAAPRLVVSNTPPVISLIEFAAGALKRQTGAAIEWNDFYLAYREHCTAKKGHALPPAEAAEQTSKLCRECDITIQRRGKKRFLAGVQLSVA